MPCISQKRQQIRRVREPPTNAPNCGCSSHSRPRKYRIPHQQADTRRTRTAHSMKEISMLKAAGPQGGTKQHQAQHLTHGRRGWWNLRGLPDQISIVCESFAGIQDQFLPSYSWCLQIFQALGGLQPHIPLSLTPMTPRTAHQPISRPVFVS